MTRLSPPLSLRQAAAVQEASLRDVVERSRGTAARLSIRYVDSPGAADYFAAAFPGMHASPQADGDLGGRLAESFEVEFDLGTDRVLVIGSDSPTLPFERLDEAREALTHADVVLGPADDGGYYLVGMRAAAWPRGRRIFQDIPWSTSRVLAASVERASRAGLRLRLLESWYDIDGASDLSRAATDAPPDSRLAAVLAELAGEGLP